MIDPKEFLGLYCPNGCTEHHAYRDDWRYMLDVIWGQKPGQCPEPMVVKCPRCGFEAWITKQFRDEIGKPDQPYLENRKPVIPEKKAKKE